MEAAARGKKALEASQYDEAIEHYTAALKNSPTSPDYLIQRSTAYQRAKNYTAALADANRAVVNAQSRAKREAIIEAQFRRGCALYSLERYGDAQFVFEIVKKKDAKHKSVTMWLGRAKTSMDKLDAEDERKQCHVKETPEVEESPVHAAASTPAATSTPATSQPPAAPTQTPADKIRHEWYQNTTHVYFTLFAKGVPKAKAQIDIQERSLNISFPIGNDSSFDFTLDPLFAAVDPAKSDPRVMSTKVEVVLAKATPGQKWTTLESKDPIPATLSTSNGSTTADNAIKAAVLNPTTTSGPAYPTSSKSGPKDWDKVVQEANKADSSDKKGSLDDDDYEGGDEANYFFKKLYKDASPDVQRAMMKSFTESNGTALNTNWDEVKKGRVETVPPDGMEAKGWEK